MKAREEGKKGEKQKEKRFTGTQARRGARAANYGGPLSMTNEKFTRPLMYRIVITSTTAAGSLFEHPGAIYRPDGAIRDSGNREAASRATVTRRQAYLSLENPAHTIV